MDIHQFQQCLYCLEELDFVQKWFDENHLTNHAFSYDKIKEMSVMFFVNVPKIQNVSMNNSPNNNNNNTTTSPTSNASSEDFANVTSSKAAKILGMNEKPNEKKKNGFFSQ